MLRWSLMHMCMVWVYKNEFLIWFSLKNLSFKFRVLLELEKWESMIFIVIWTGQVKRQFCPWNHRSAVSFYGRGRRIQPPNWTREAGVHSATRFGGQSKPPIKTQKETDLKISHSAVSIRRPGRRLNRRIKPENNKCIRSNSAVSIRRPDRRS